MRLAVDAKSPGLGSLYDCTSGINADAVLLQTCETGLTCIQKEVSVCVDTAVVASLSAPTRVFAAESNWMRPPMLKSSGSMVPRAFSFVQKLTYRRSACMHVLHVKSAFLAQSLSAVSAPALVPSPSAVPSSEPPAATEDSIYSHDGDDKAQMVEGADTEECFSLIAGAICGSKYC